MELEASNLVQVRSILLSMYDILLLNPAIIGQAQNERIKNSLSYCEKALNIYGTIDNDCFDEDELLGRVLTKIRSIYFS